MAASSLSAVLPAVVDLVPIDKNLLFCGVKYTTGFLVFCNDRLMRNGTGEKRGERCIFLDLTYFDDFHNHLLDT